MCYNVIRFQGVDAISDYPITFHYAKPKEMYMLAYFTYHLKVYGVNGQNFVRLNPYYLGKT